MQERHSHWFNSGAFATIALVAILKAIDDVKDQNQETKWTVSGISIALGMAGLAIFANMILRDKFVGTHLEGGMAVMTFGMWAAVLPAMMDPANEIATTTGGAFMMRSYGAIYNANLYFFSWGATLTSLAVLVGFMKEKFGKEDTKNSPFMYWAMLAGTSLIVMASASRQYKDVCDDSAVDDTIYCERTEFAVGLGAASGLLCLGWMALCLVMAVPTMIDALMAFLVLAAWVVGVTLITFGDEKAAAPTLSNLYFFTWGSFGIVCRLLAIDFYAAMKDMMPGETEEGGEEEEKKKEEEAGSDEAADVPKDEQADEAIDA